MGLGPGRGGAPHLRTPWCHVNGGGTHTDDFDDEGEVSSSSYSSSTATCLWQQILIHTDGDRDKGGPVYASYTTDFCA